MGKTMIEKILGSHAGREVLPGDIVELEMDVRAARDFGGANVVKNLKDCGLGIDDPKRTFFTFDCNPGGSDQKYAANQQACRMYAREHGIRTYDVDQGIGTHLAIDDGLIFPGGTLVSTDSHANIEGALGAFGQGMGDQDIAHAFAHGKVWFKVPPSLKIMLKGTPGPEATPKDIALAIMKVTGAAGLLGYAAEVYGQTADALALSGRITVSSLATEMGGIIIFFPPSEEIVQYCRKASGKDFTPVYPDSDASYDKTIEVDLEGLGPMVSRPGHPDDVVPIVDVKGTKVDSCFIGSCTNGRYEDLKAAADILKDRKVAPGVVLKIVPATRNIWQRCLDEGIIDTFMKAGALVGNSGCAGCAAGQIGQNGPGEITISTGNRNFPGKQGKGKVYLASPATVAATAVSGVITTASDILPEPVLFKPSGKVDETEQAECEGPSAEMPTVVTGRAWVIEIDNIDTDMIFHNRYLSITDISQMGQYCFDNLEGYEDFAKRAKPQDIIFTGGNFGCGSSRQQAVDCFKCLETSAVVAESFGAIYERNAINAGMPIMNATIPKGEIETGDEVTVDFTTGKIENLTRGKEVLGQPFSETQMGIYKRGGLLKK